MSDDLVKRLRDLAQAKDARIAELERENKVMAALVETIGNAFNEAGVKIFAETQKARAAAKEALAELHREEKRLDLP